MIPAIIACKVIATLTRTLQGNAPCTGARELYGRFCDQANQSRKPPHLRFSREDLMPRKHECINPNRIAHA